MDFFFDDLALPSTSQSTSKSGHEASQMSACLTGNTDHDSPGGKSSSVSTAEIQEQHTSSNIEDISGRVQDMLEKINSSRTSNQKIMDSFQEKFMEKVTGICKQMECHMYTVYEENSSEMQVKLQELSEILESCTKLNMELMEANRALSGLRESLARSQMPEQ